MLRPIIQRSLLITALLATAAAGLSAHAQTLAQWGEPGGQTDIVASDQPLKPQFPMPTYRPDVSNSPGDEGYYAGDATEGKTPIFSAAAGRDGANQFYARLIQDNAEHGDRIHLGNHSSKLGESAEAMVVWQETQFLPTAGNTLDTLAAEAFSMQPDEADATIHFILENDEGWFVSEGQALRGGFRPFEGVAAEMDWKTFTPLDGGVATIGDRADPDLTGVRSVGVYFKMTADEPSNLGVFLRYFNATVAGGGEPLPIEPE